LAPSDGADNGSPSDFFSPASKKPSGFRRLLCDLPQHKLGKHADRPGLGAHFSAWFVD
jgi:hypothetical protein